MWPAFGLEQAVLDLRELQHRAALGVDEPQHVLRPERPSRDIDQRRKGGGASGIEIDLVAPGRRLDAEGQRTTAVTVDIGNLPAADHALSGFTDGALGADDSGCRDDQSREPCDATRHEFTRCSTERTLTQLIRRVMRTRAVAAMASPVPE